MVFVQMKIASTKRMLASMHLALVRTNANRKAYGLCDWRMWRADNKTPRIDLSTVESIHSFHFFSSS